MKPKLLVSILTFALIPLLLLGGSAILAQGADQAQPAAPLTPITGTTRTLYADRDTFVGNLVGTNNYGTHTTLTVGRNACIGYEFPEWGRALIHFDLSPIPAGQVITSAKLRLYLRYYTTSAAGAIGAHRITSSWTETGATWNNQPSHSVTAAGSASIGSTREIWYEWDVTNLVKDWYAGAYTNHGFKMIAAGNPEPTCWQRIFDSRENTSGKKPELKIVYVAPTATRTPTRTLTRTPSLTRTATATYTATKPPTDFLYIYREDRATGEAFQQFFAEHGYKLDLASMADLLKVPLAPYRTIIIGYDTGDMTSWGDSRLINYLIESQKAIVGIGEGGYAFFGKLSLDIGYPNGGHGSETRSLVLDRSQSIYRTPFAISIPRDDILTLYKESPCVLLNWDRRPLDVLPIGRDPDSQVYYTIAQEQERFLLWGYGAAPRAMIEPCQELFINACHLPITFPATPTPTRTPTRTYTPTATRTRTPTRTPTPGPDLTISNLEVTQAIQDLSNSVVLIANKRTYVRAHVRASSGSHANVLGSFYIYRGGALLAGPLPADNAGSRITVKASPDRGQVNDSFFVELPPAAIVSGACRVCLSLNPDHLVPESNYGNNWACTDVNFTNSPKMRVRIYNVRYQQGGVTRQATADDIFGLISWLRRVYPVPSVQWEWRTLDWTRSDLPSAAGCGVVNNLLAAARLLDGNPSGWRYYGMVSDAGGFMRGCAAGIPAYIASGPTGTDTWGWDNDGTYGDWYGAHELGHTYGRPHAEFCGAGGGVPYPYPNGYIGGPAANPNRFYGWDVELRVVRSPTWTDLMTYCDWEWISDFNYHNIRNRLLDEGVWSTREEAKVIVPGEYLAVFGSANLNTGETALDVLYRLHDIAAPEPPTPSDDWTIQLLGGEGQVLDSYPFTPKEADPDEFESGTEGTGQALIQEVVGWHEGTARVVIKFMGEIVAERVVSGHAPQVTLEYPNGGEVLSQARVTVRWNAKDDDGDKLAYTLLYSADAGATWETVAVNLTEAEHEVDMSLWPGSDQALFRVIASDGVNTGEDRSDGTFTVATKAPQAHIVSPEAGDAFITGQQVMLVGEAYDVEDGILPEGALAWSSDVEGDLGSGPHLAVTTLHPGAHVITLRATDSDGKAGTATVTVFVRTASAPISLPLLIKN